MVRDAFSGSGAAMPTDERAALVEATAVEALRRAEDVEERLPAVAEAWVRANLAGEGDPDLTADQAWVWCLPSAMYHYRKGHELYEVAVAAMTVRIQRAGRAWFEDNYITLAADGRGWSTRLYRRGEGPAYDREHFPYDTGYDTIPKSWTEPKPTVDLAELDAALAELS
jgi:hypothetical protein